MDISDDADAEECTPSPPSTQSTEYVILASACLIYMLYHRCALMTVDDVMACSVCFSSLADMPFDTLRAQYLPMVCRASLPHSMRDPLFSACPSGETRTRMSIACSTSATSAPASWQIRPRLEVLPACVSFEASLRRYFSAEQTMALLLAGQREYQRQKQETKMNAKGNPFALCVRLSIPPPHR